MGTGQGIALVVHILPLHHLGHHSGGGGLGEAPSQPFIELAGRKLLPGQKLHRTGAGLGGVGGFFLLSLIHI